VLNVLEKKHFSTVASTKLLFLFSNLLLSQAFLNLKIFLSPHQVVRQLL